MYRSLGNCLKETFGRRHENIFVVWKRKTLSCACVVNVFVYSLIMKIESYHYVSQR